MYLNDKSLSEYIEKHQVTGEMKRCAGLLFTRDITIQTKHVLVGDRYYGVLIELSMRQQFAGPLGSSVAMQMPALHFPLGPPAAAAATRCKGL